MHTCFKPSVPYLLSTNDKLNIFSRHLKFNFTGSEDDMEEDPLLDERQPSHQGFQRIDAVETQPAQV